MVTLGVVTFNYFILFLTTAVFFSASILQHLKLEKAMPIWQVVSAVIAFVATVIVLCYTAANSHFSLLYWNAISTGASSCAWILYELLWKKESN